MCWIAWDLEVITQLPETKNSVICTVISQHVKWVLNPISLGLDSLEKYSLSTDMLLQSETIFFVQIHDTFVQFHNGSYQEEKVLKLEALNWYSGSHCFWHNGTFGIQFLHPCNGDNTKLIYKYSQHLYVTFMWKFGVWWSSLQYSYTLN